MGGTDEIAALGHEEERHHISPLVVGSLSVPDPTGGAEHGPVAMMLTVDVDAVPGLREVIDRQRAGEEFDVISKWGAAVDKSGVEGPQVIVDFFLPEFDLGIAIHVDVDPHPNSLQAAIRTGRIVVVDPELSMKLQAAEEIGTAMEELRPLTVEPPDPKPAISVLQQRFDYPREAYVPERRVLTPETSETAVGDFFANARIVASAAVQYRGDGPCTIILIDPDLASLKERVARDAKLEGRWGALQGGEHNAVAFDAFAEGEPIGRWLLFDPPDEIVRAGSNGEHSVAVMAELSVDDQERAERQWGEAIHAWVSHVEALRALRFGDAQARAPDA